MFITPQGNLYLGDMQHGDREATPAEISAYRSAVAQGQFITALDGLLLLDQSGLSGAYEAWANDPSRTFSERAFIDKAQTWRRNDPTLISAADSLGLTAQQIDDLFQMAATL